jgi:hypothetical protein
VRISRTVQLTGATLSALCLLTACGGKSGGTETPSSSAPPSSSADVAANLKVPAPLPTGDLLSNPCAVIAPSQYDALNFAGAGTKRESTNGSLAADCKWASKSNEGNVVFISPLPINKNGISDIYSQKAQAAYFEPVTINGYPGVLTDVHDGRPSGNCSVWVGVTDQLAVSVNAQISSDSARANSCSIAQNVAEAMIQHLKGAA